jgi:hypothetical protein
MIASFHDDQAIVSPRDRPAPCRVHNAPAGIEDPWWRMDWTLPYLLGRSYQRSPREILALCRSLDEDTLRRHVPGTNLIAHDLWHTARWADHLQSIISEMSPRLTERLGVRPEIWHVEHLRDAWGMSSLDLGHAETGMGMDPVMAITMPLPPTSVLLDYADRAIEASIAVVEGLTEDELRHPAKVAQERSTWLDPGPESRGLVFNWVLAYLRHDAEHLGAMRTLAHVLHGST